MRPSRFAIIVVWGVLLSSCSKRPEIAPAAVASTTASAIQQPTTASPGSAATASSAQQSQSEVPSTAKVVTSDQTDGPFRVGEQTFTFVKRVQKIDGSKSAGDSTVEWWELRDEAGHALYRQPYLVNFQNGTFDEAV